MADSYFDANDPAFGALIDLFVDELSDRIASVEQAIDGGDLAALRRIGHQLKGAAGCYGFQELTNQGYALQKACDEGTTKAAITTAATELIAGCRDAIESHAAATLGG